MFREYFVSKEWAMWAWAGAVMICLVMQAEVHVHVLLNSSFDEKFMNQVQHALSEPGSVTQSSLLAGCWSFLRLAVTYGLLESVKAFIVQHWTFRWRQSLSHAYVKEFEALRHVEGASQRVQDALSRFVRQFENIGAGAIKAVLTLIGFVPILGAISDELEGIPVFGKMKNSLVWACVAFSVGGTMLMALVGIKLPGIEYNNQMAEAAFRKGLVEWEDDDDYLGQEECWQSFLDVRQKYFRSYMHKAYFNVFSHSYQFAQFVVPFLLLTPTIASGTIKIGLVMKTRSAWSHVLRSFEYLLINWDMIIELQSVYMRLQDLEIAREGKHPFRMRAISKSDCWRREQTSDSDDAV